MIPEKRLDSGTRPVYSPHMDETWADIPDLSGYEVSTAGRVRKWTTTVNGCAKPLIYEGITLRGETVYTLAGNPYTIDDLMRWTFGEDALEDFELGHEPGESQRDLSQFEVSEITLAEGYKPAHEVAEEFRIDSSRVRGIWDGNE